MAETDFSVNGWDDFVKAMEEIADPTAWQNSKNMLLEKMGTAVQSEIMPLVPVNTSHLVNNIFVGKPEHDSIEVGTNVEYALFVNDGHVVRGENEIYVAGVHFAENGVENAKPQLKRIGEDFIRQVYEKVL